MTVAQLNTQPPVGSLRIRGELSDGFDRILTPEALQFVVDLERRFGRRRQQLLGLRVDRQRRLNQGEIPGFRVETAELRAANWQIKQAPQDLQDRRVEIIVPVARPAIIDALNSGANSLIADFEEAHIPTWRGTLEGQINLYEAIRGNLSDTAPEAGPSPLNRQRTTLIVRPRAWHQEEKHLEVDDQAVSASLFDFGLFIFHNALALTERGSGPYFTLPKLESYIEAQLWADVFAYAEESLGLSHGRICCTVQIGTLPAVFEMEEILYTLRDYATGLNSDRWGYIFNFIKRLHANPEWISPDRDQISLRSDFLQHYSQLLIKTCHRRGAHAISGMTIPSSTVGDDEASTRLRSDREHEAISGYDGSWVFHPESVAEAKAVYDRIMPRANQIDRQLGELAITEADLLQLPTGQITEQGVADNIRLCLDYLATWLDGKGSAPTHQFMENAAAEIARSQIWQWIRHPKGILEDGRNITFELFSEGVARELEQIGREIGEAALAARPYQAAAKLLSEIIANDRFVEFLTQPACKMPA